MPPISKEYISTPLLKMDMWFRQAEYKGFDPYDIKAHKYVIGVANRRQNSMFGKIYLELLYEVFLMFPVLSRKLFRIKKAINPKAMGLLAAAYLNLSRITGENKYEDKSKEYLSWLEKNAVQKNDGLGWGYPFNWQSTRFIPANSPNGIVTTAVADAFWQYYKFTGDKHYLSVCEKIAKFLSELPKDEIDSERVCFSYTTLFINHVHNLNLFVAEFLLKVGLETSNRHYQALARKAIKYTVEEQKADGSFDYNGPPENPQNFIDNYHTGFVLRMLHSIWLQESNDQVYKALEKGYDFYLANFFKDNTIPKFKPDSLYRVDIHSCAESILCICTIAPTFNNKGIDIADNVFFWTVKHLWNRKGYFYHGIFRSRIFGIRFKSRIAYIRWSQAWMFSAIVKLSSVKYAG